MLSFSGLSRIKRYHMTESVADVEEYDINMLLSSEELKYIKKTYVLFIVSTVN